MNLLPAPDGSSRHERRPGPGADAGPQGSCVHGRVCLRAPAVRSVTRPKCYVVTRPVWAGAGRPRAPASKAGPASGHRRCGLSLGQRATRWHGLRSVTRPTRHVVTGPAPGQAAACGRPLGLSGTRLGRPPGYACTGPRACGQRLAGYVVARAQPPGGWPHPLLAAARTRRGGRLDQNGSGQLHPRSLRRSLVRNGSLIRGVMARHASVCPVGGEPGHLLPF